MVTTTTNAAPSYRSKERRSLCEESMLLIVNILRLSSLSLATRSGTRPNGKPSSSPSIITPSPPSFPPTNRNSHRDRRCDQPAHGFIGKRAMKPDPNVGSTTTRTSYVMLPVSEDVVRDEHHPMGDGGGDVEFAEYIRRFHRNNEDEMNANVEGRASDYIKRFHEKNRVDDQGSKGLPFVVQPPPPPPPPVKRLRQRAQPGSTNRRLSY